MESIKAVKPKSFPLSQKMSRSGEDYPNEEYESMKKELHKQLQAI